MSRKRLIFEIILLVLSGLFSISYYAEGDWALGTLWCLSTFIGTAKIITD